MKTHKRYIGIDMGTKRIGVALSDEGAKFAFPHAVIEPSKLDQIALQEVGYFQFLAEHIKDIAQTYDVDTIIIGKSQDFKGNDNPIMKSVNELVLAMQGVGLKTILMPEFMTSSQASRHQGDIKSIDASAAAIILQTYLDSLHFA